MGRSRSCSVRVWALSLLLAPSPALAGFGNSDCPRLLEAGPPNPRVASYRISAALDATLHRVTAHSQIHWTNPSDSPTSELYLHAYMNAFAHTGTRFMRSGSAGRTSQASLSRFGKLTINRLVAQRPEQVDLLPFLSLHSPSDPNDATDLRVALPFEVAPGASLILELDFETTLPSLLERAGFSRTFHAVAQWFPKLARRDRSGTWHHFTYEALSEFSSDFGDYDVTIEVPQGYIVAAPGVLASSSIQAGRTLERYCAANVHDFAWFAWDQFVVSESRAGPVQIRHYASRDQRRNAASVLDTVRWGLNYYGSRYSPYPYPSLTIVHPPDDARGASGMEYPQLITTGGPWYYPYLGLHTLDAVTLHELAHQWFYGVVATDEYLWPVLDEGLASWAEIDALAARHGSASLLDTALLEVSEAALRRVLARSATRRGPLASRAIDFGDFDRLAAQIYARFPTLLETISRVYGPQLLQQALRAYVQAHQFSAPDPKAFLEVMQQHLPASATAALSSALFTDGWVDYAVRRVEASPRGAAGEGFANRVLLERRGSFDFPILLELQFADGHVARRHLESLDSAIWVEWPHISPLVCATLDPDHRITIDDDLSNQTLRVSERPFLGRLATALHLALSTLLSLAWP